MADIVSCPLHGPHREDLGCDRCNIVRSIQVPIHLPAYITSPDFIKEKRWQAACMAMQGFLSNPNIEDLKAAHIASDSFMVADAMLKAGGYTDGN